MSVKMTSAIIAHAKAHVILSASTNPEKALFIDKNIPHAVKLAEKESCTHDVRHLKLRLPDPEMVSGIQPGNHVRVTAEMDGKSISRFYSPVSNSNDKGFFDLVLKIYPLSETSLTLGCFSRYMDSVKIGDTLRMAGPFGQLSYLGYGRFKWNDKEGTVREFQQIGMIAGGTGITPMVQIIRSVVRDPDDCTKLHVLTTNKREEDVVFRNELEDYATNRPVSFKLTQTLTRVSANERGDWPHSLGRISPEMVKEALPVVSDTTLILICGRVEMNKAAKEICTALGYPHIHVY